jgi:hypothetical protein
VALNHPPQILYSSNIAKTLPKALPVAEGYNTSGVLYVSTRKRRINNSAWLAVYKEL